MARPRSTNKKRMTRFRVNNRGASPGISPHRSTATQQPQPDRSQPASAPQLPTLCHCSSSSNESSTKPRLFAIVQRSSIIVGLLHIPTPHFVLPSRPRRHYLSLMTSRHQKLEADLEIIDHLLNKRYQNGCLDSGTGTIS